MDEPITISVLVAARKNSKYLAKFLAGYFQRTSDTFHTEILVMANQADSWNEEILDYYCRNESSLRVMRENAGLGRAGLHEYFNTLYQRCSGEWVIYFCEDHFITMSGWDDYLRKVIAEQNLRSDQPYCLAPKFDNVGTMNHVLSRGFIEAQGGKLGRNGWIDSYINCVCERIPSDRVIKLNEETFHDFTHDQPTPMDDCHLKTVISDEGRALPAFDSAETREMIEADSQLINQYIEAHR